MSGFFEVTDDDIERLSAADLTELLRRLLLLDAAKNGIHRSSVVVPIKIDVPDGGEDGLVEWTDGPSRTDWIPSRVACFQMKATRMHPAACKRELLVDRGRGHE